MKSLLIIAVTLGVVSADIGIGYHYNVPQTSYGIPSYQTGSSSNVYNTGYNYKVPANTQNYQSGFSQQSGLNSGSTGGYQTGFQSTGSNTGSGYQTGFGLGGQYQSSGLSNGISSGGGVLQPSYQVGGSGGQVSSVNYQSSNQYQSSAVQKYQEYYNQLQQQPAQVFKHFYVHAAPEEHEAPKLHQPVQLPPPQKHYKIIFIKAPSQPAPAPQFIPVQQQNEEKTIVYVLVNKPEEQQNIVVPKIPQKPPSKPEVFFIKYKNKEDSQAVINNIVNDYNKGQESVSFSNLGSGSNAAGSVDSISDVSSQIFGHVTGGQAEGQGSSSTFQTQSQLALGGGSGSSGIEQVLGAGNVDSGSSTSVYESSVGGSGVSSTDSTSGSSSSSNYENFNTISTSQGVPHETYGPPKFRV